MRYTFRPYAKTPLVRGHLNLGGANPQGGRIDVNNLYLERDGKPWVPIMGEFHFSRGSRPHWYRELCKMKAGGVTVVATYLFWIYHEEEEGRFDFTGDRDIRAFLLECQRAGLEAVIRIGPWAHGECRNGGFPDWLLQKPYPLRDNNPGYLEKARLWYREIYRQVQGLSYQEGGPIVGIQLENELGEQRPPPAGPKTPGPRGGLPGALVDGDRLGQCLRRPNPRGRGAACLWRLRRCPLGQHLGAFAALPRLHLQPDAQRLRHRRRPNRPNRPRRLAPPLRALPLCHL